MKVLVVCQYYYPEPVRITDICEELVRMGNDVTVLTDIPNYPMGEIYDGYKNIKDETINGVKVHRCYTIPRKTGAIRRLLNYYSFAISSSMHINKLKDDFDVVFVNQLSPVLMAKAGIKYKKKYNKKLVLYSLDLWPESLTVGGIKKESLIFKYFYKVSKRIYTSVDKLLITSKEFKNYFIENFNISEDKIEYLPQYAESLFNPDICKKKKNRKVDLMFAGNIGVAQSIDTILDAALELKDYKNLYWHIVGDGKEYERLVKKAKDNNLDNIIFYGRMPVEKMPEMYSKADAMLVTLQGGSLISKTLPGKVQSYMAAGKAIIGAIDGETKTIIEEAKCGFCGKADNISELIDNVKRFINCKNKEKLEENSYNYYIKNFEKKKFMNQLVNVLKKEGKLK